MLPQVNKLINKLLSRQKQFTSKFIDRVFNFKLRLAKGVQKKRFEEYGAQCSQLYQSLRRKDISKYITKTWEQNCRDMESLLLPRPIFFFLRSSKIQSIMTVGNNCDGLGGELSFCERFYSSKFLRQILEEDCVGNAVISNFKYMTSQTRIHHLYHLLKFQEKTDRKLDTLIDVIEWGGGYGDMARLLRNLNSTITCTIIDLPLFSCIQWIYLGSILSKEQINLIRCKEDKIERNKINLLPLCFLESCNPKSEMFIATWSLSESSDYAIDYVKLSDFFNAKHFLIAYQENNKSFPKAGRVGEIAAASGASIEANAFFRGNYYAFR